MLNRTIVAATATALTISGSTVCWAADLPVAASASAPATVPASAPLAPGHAAGIHTAQETLPGHVLVAVGGLAILGVGVGLIASGGRDHSSMASTSSTGSGAH